MCETPDEAYRAVLSAYRALVAEDGGIEAQQARLAEYNAARLFFAEGRWAKRSQKEKG